MSNWTVKKFRRSNGECPVDDWLCSREVSPRDKSRIDAKIDVLEQIEMADGIPSGWVVDFKSTDLQRLAIKAPDKKAVRFLCEKIVHLKTIILFNGMLKKGKKYPSEKISEAKKLQAEFKIGSGNVEDYE